MTTLFIGMEFGAV